MYIQILHTLVGMGSAALAAAAIVLNRYGGLNFPQGIKEVLT